MFHLFLSTEYLSPGMTYILRIRFVYGEKRLKNKNDQLIMYECSGSHYERAAKQKTRRKKKQARHKLCKREWNGKLFCIWNWIMPCKSRKRSQPFIKLCFINKKRDRSDQTKQNCSTGFFTLHYSFAVLQRSDVVLCSISLDIPYDGCGGQL